jgi:hypothetical protein
MMIPRSIDLSFLDKFILKYRRSFNDVDPFIRNFIHDKYHAARETPETFSHRDYVALQNIVKALSVERPDYAMIRNTLAKYCLDSGERDRVQKLNGMF